MPDLRLSSPAPWLFALATFSLLALAALLLSACDELGDEGGTGAALTPSTRCSPACTGELVCVIDESGVPTCLQPTEGCRPDVCAQGAVCAEGVCTFQDRDCPGGCASGQTCIYGNCITSYTSTNACAPLDECRARCGLDVICIQRCEDAASRSCNECRQQLGRCEARENCEANATTCCADSFCGCFPTNPGCSDTPCDLCVLEADGDGQVLEECIADTPSCSSCLQPFFNCRDDLDNPGDAPVACQSELCSCISGDVEPACAD